jgi:hypothetical protein
MEFASILSSLAYTSSMIEADFAIILMASCRIILKTILESFYSISNGYAI